MASWFRKKTGLCLNSDSDWTIMIDRSSTYQTMIGFGASMAYYTNWVYDHPYRDLIYKTIFSELQPTLVRFRNTYALEPCEATTTRDMTIDAYALAAARQTLGYEPLVLLTSWSPPVNLKASGKTHGGGHLAKFDGTYCYGHFANWWVESVNAYRAVGVNPRWVSIQNEPDYDPSGHDGCNFAIEEKRNEPGYDCALRATYSAFRSQLTNPPGLVGPEHTGIDGHLQSAGALDEFDAVGNHLYSSGEFDNPASLIAALKVAGKWAKKQATKDLFMTEFGNLKKHSPDDPVKLATIIHHTLTIGHVTAYWHWDLFWGAGTDEGSLVLVDNPFTGNRADWSNENGFTLTQSFWYFAHFCRFVRPGFKRVAASSPIDSVLVSAFSGPGDKFCVVVINNSSRPVSSLPLSGLPAGSTTLYQSTLSTPMAHLGPLRNTRLPDLPQSSITTILVN